MVDPSNRDYDAYHSVPAGVQSFNVGNGPPLLAGKYPAHNGYVDKLRPALWADYDDPDNFPAGAAAKYSYRICNGTPQAPTGCQSSGWTTNAAWQVPAGVLAWGRPSFWYVTLSDTQNNSPEYGPFSFTPLVAQPEVTSHLAGAPDDADVPGLNPQIGNYSTSTTDASVPVLGPPLAVERTYNSQDPRTDGAFGPGWASPLDQRLVPDGDGSDNIVVTLSSGRTVRFGKADGVYVPPPGMNLTLLPMTGTPHGWMLRDPSGQKRVFDDRGRLSSVEDSSGRRQTFTYDATSARPSRIKDEASGRSLWPTWIANRLTAVALDSPQAGAPTPMWTYTYDGDKLIRACSPLSAASCTSYTYTSSSHYRSVVLDDNPAAYWPLGGGAGNLDNVAARSPGESEAIARGVLSGRPGPLAGSSDGALGFTGAADSYVALPNNLLSSSVAFSVELWFKAAVGKSGVLFGSQTVSLPAVPSSGWAPNLAVGTDGKLRGYVWAGASGDAMVSPGVVSDGQWHHAVLSTAVDRQTLYLDGVQIGQVSGKVLDHFAMTRHYLGNGYTKYWPAASTDYFPFTGEIDEVAVFRHSLAATQVAAHYAARAATARLSTTVEPGSFTATTAVYEPGSGRVTTMTDRNGATWTLDAPTLQGRSRVVTLSSTARDAITYTYDADHNGRLVTRTDSFGTQTWGYNAAGFIDEYVDQNGRLRRFFTDARGNRIADSFGYNSTWRYRYYGYETHADDPFDPRNDQLLWASDGRDGASSTEHRTWYYRDAKGRLTEEIRPNLPGAQDWTVRHSFAYTAGTEAAVGGGTVPPGLLASETSFSGGTTRYSYNRVGDRVRTVDPVGLTTEVAYDGIGRPTSTRVTGVVDGTSVDYGTTTTTYNAASLPEAVTFPGVVNPITGLTHTPRTRYTYDASGRTTQVDSGDATGGDATRTWKTGYDPAGHITSSTAPDGAVTTNQWDESGNKVRETRPGGQVLEHRYDDRDLLVETAATGAAIDPMNPTATRMVLESRAYDPAGQLATVVDAMGRETAYRYWENGLLEAIGHVYRSTDGRFTSTALLERNDYDDAGNVVRKTEAGGVVHDYVYDNLGNVVQEVLDPAGLMRSTSYQMRGDGRPSTAVSGNGLALDVDTPGETSLLATDNGSQIDDTRARYADGTNSFTYRFALPSDTSGATFITDIANQFLVETSTDNSTWSTALQETRDVRDGSNRDIRTIDLTPVLARGKTIYLRVRDSQPTNGWGGRIRRSELRFQRAGAPSEEAAFGYDAMGRATTTTVTDPEANPRALVTTIKRDPRGLQTALTDPTGAVTTYGYDTAGQIQRIVEPPRSVWRDGVATDNHSPTTVVGHNTFGEVTESRDAAGAIVRTARDAMGREIRRTFASYTPPGASPITPVEETDYDESGLPAKTTDALGRVTTYDHDKHGWLTTITAPDPDGSGPATAPVTRYQHNRLGEVLETEDPLGARRLATYDDQGNQITDTVTERSGGTTYYYTTTIVPDARGRILRVTTPLGNKTTTTYNTADERLTTTDADGVTTEFRYSATGRVTAQVLAGALATGYGYDALGRNITVTDHTVTDGVLSAPLRTSRTAYDRVGRVTRQTSAAGRLTDYTYDAGGQLRTITQLRDTGAPATAVTVKLDYDAAGHRTRMTDGNDHATEYHYNDWGSPVEVVEPSTETHPTTADRTWTSIYDAAGQVTDVRMPGGVSIARTYDRLGRVTDETGDGAEGETAARSFAYDAVGNVVGAGTPAGDNAYAWNDRGLLTNASGPGGTATFGYDSDGRLTTRTDGSGAATFTYTGAARLKTATDPLVSKTLSYLYRPTGEVQAILQGAGMSSRAFGYDDLGRLTSDVLIKADGGRSATTTYGYDNDDLLTETRTSGITGAYIDNYSYDGLARLTSWGRPELPAAVYGYDGASNRTTVSSRESGTRTYAFDARNRLMKATGGGEEDLTNTWSARGTLRSSTQGATTTSHTFDAFDQMLTATDPGYTVRYAYDSLGRVSTRNGVAFGYADLGDSPVLVPGQGTAQPGKIFRDPESRPLSATLDGGPGRSLFQDARHGDIRGWYDPADGTLERSAVYNPSGEVVASSADRLPLGFQGGWSDPQTGLLNAHTRWYDPGAAGFTSRDTWTLTPDPVSQANRYGYGNANPLNTVDTDGHNPLALIGAVFVGSNPVGWGVLAVVAVASVGYLSYKGYQSYEYHHNVAGSASTWSGPATAAARPGTTVQDDYAARQDAAARAQAASDYQQSATQARIDAQVAEMTAEYNKRVQAYLDAARAERERKAAEEAARIDAFVKAYDARLASAKAEAIRAATPGPVGTTVVKPPAAVALVSGGRALTNTRSTAQVPGTVYASSDGADAPNAAAVAGAVAATGLLEITGAADPGGGPDGGCNDPRKIVEDTAKEVIEDLGMDGIDARISDAQWKHPEYIWAYRGSEVHKEVRDRLGQNYPDLFDGTMNGTGPDFTVRTTGEKIELTTPGEVAKHRAKGGEYDNCGYALYDSLKKK